MRMSLLVCTSLVVLMLVGTGCYEVVYTAEYKEGGSCIKFEDAMLEVEPDVWVEACLGEDGAVQGDLFYVELDGYTEDIDVTVKAGKCKETVTLVWDVIEVEGIEYDVLAGDVCGFTIYAGPEGDVWIFGVISDDVEGGKGGTAALSNITFCFGDGMTVTGPEEGDFEAYRADEEELDEILGDD